MQTSRARVSATTGNESNLFASGNIDVEANAPHRLLLSHEGLYPGLVVESCFEVSYKGSIDAVDVRFFGELTTDDGLADLLQVAVWTGTGAVDATCDEFTADGEPRFVGSVARLWSSHPDFESGLALLDDAHPDDHLAVRVRATIPDGDGADAAQGRSTDFVAVVEARP